jgi:hypothetical protein
MSEAALEAAQASLQVAGSRNSSSSRNYAAVSYCAGEIECLCSTMPLSGTQKLAAAAAAAAVQCSEPCGEVCVTVLV